MFTAPGGARTDIIDSVSRLASVVPDRLEVSGVEATMAEIARVRSWLHSLELGCVTRSRALAEQGRGAGASGTLVGSGRRTSHGARLAEDRAKTVAEAPELGERLAAGDIGAEHVDAVARATKGLDDDAKARMFDDTAQLARQAARMPADSYADWCRRKARAAEGDQGAATRLEKLQKAVRGRKSVDPDTGMYWLNAEFDPLLGERIFATVDAQARTMAKTLGLPYSPRLEGLAVGALMLRGATDPADGDCDNALDVATEPGDHPTRDDIEVDTANHDTAATTGTARRPGRSAGATSGESPAARAEGAPRSRDPGHGKGGRDRKGGRRHGGNNGSGSPPPLGNAPPGGPVPFDDPRLELPQPDRPDQSSATPDTAHLDLTRVLAPGTVDTVVLIDLDTLTGGPHEHSTCETEHGTALPVASLQRLACSSNVIGVIRGAEGDVLNAGRTARVANRAQRRALRAMYRTCAFAGCTKPFHWCEMHHIIPWWNDGPTDLDNLIPLCVHHHHLVHEGGWRLTLGKHRHLTIHRPDGRVHAASGLQPQPARRNLT